MGAMALLPRHVLAQSEAIRLGFVQALSGPNSTAGVGFNRGIVAAVEDINAAGGRQIDLITRDSQGDPTKSVNSVQELISRANAHAILGPSNSGETLAVGPILARANMPHIHTGTVDALVDPVKFPNSFRSGASNKQWLVAVNRYVVDILKFKKAAVIGDNTGYGTASAADCEADLNARGATAVYTGLVDLTAPDLTAEMTRARDAGAETVIAWSASAGLLARILNARADIGWDIPVCGHTSFGTGAVQKLLTKPENWENVFQVAYRPCCFDADGNLPGPQADFVARMKGRIDLSDVALWTVAWGYDAVHLIAEAIESNGYEKQAIIDYLNTVTNYPTGLFGHYTFTPEQHNGYPDADVIMALSNSLHDGAYKLAPGV